MTALIALVIFLPLLGGLSVVVGADTRLVGYVTVVAGAGSFAAAIGLAVRVANVGHYQALGGLVYADAVSALFALTVSLVVLLASLGSAAYLRAEEERHQLSRFQVRLYFGFFSVFAAAMLGSLLVGNLGMLWVLIEASTLASAVLVGLEAKQRSFEAAWKYVIISSLGVTIALVATLFLFYAGNVLHLTSEQRLTWEDLFAHAHGLSPGSMRFAFLLAVVGYGTKVGLAPMHTWLPDAHSEAPSPASAMLSAALLSTGMYAIIRFDSLAKGALGDNYPSNVLLFFGFLTIFIGVMFMVRRGNFKRTFAYSSIEHMGIVSVALGFGGTLGIYGALLLVLTHAIGKAVLFLSSGDLVLAYRSRESAEVRGAIGTMPVAGVSLLLASFAVAGSPPFGVFLAELTIVRAGFAGAAPWLAGLLLVFLAIGFIALTGTTVSMAAGDWEGPPLTAYAAAPSKLLAAVPLVGGLATLGLLGVWIPGGLNELLVHSLRAIS
jgi:hydrogenase-4 component F